MSAPTNHTTTDAPATTGTKKTAAARGVTELYRHSLRPGWGLAVIAWEDGSRRGYQFDDGKLRVFKQGYYSLLEPATDVNGSADAIITDLRDTISLSGNAHDAKELAPAYPFDQQVRIFEMLYPGGFSSQRWVADCRGDARMRRVKRHRGPASDDARTRLAAAWIDDRLAADAPGEVVAVLAEVLRGTDLVPAAKVTRLEEMGQEHWSAVAQGLRDVLWGERPYGKRFKDYVAALTAALGERPNWRLATAAQALVHPSKHMCVRRTAMLKQAALFAPRAAYTKKPRRLAYSNFRKVARITRDRLLDAGHEPRDLLDIHDFIWKTLRPAAAKLLA